MSEKTVFTAEMAWPEFEARVKGGDTPVFMPIGSHEQHGLHLPLNTDCLVPTAFAERAAKEVGGVVVPTFVYGYKSQQKSGGGQHVPGTLSLDGATTIGQIKDIIKELARNGARRFVMMNGHYENQAYMVEAIDLALRELRWEGIRDARFVATNYWDFIDKPTIERIYPDGFLGAELEHAGVMETSMMLVLHPSLVRMDRVEDHKPASFPPYDVYPIKGELTPRQGSLSSPRKATKEKGEILLDVCTKGIVGAVRKELAKG